MDSLASEIDCGVSSHKKHKKMKRKNAATVSTCGQSSSNVSADNEIQSEVVERGKNKKWKMEDSFEKVDAIVSGDNIEPRKKKKKLRRSIEEVHTNNLPMSTEECTEHDNSTPKKKKKSKKSFNEIGKEISTYDSVEKSHCKGKLLDNNQIIANDSMCEGLGAKIRKGMKEELEVMEGSVENSVKNNFCETTVHELSKAAKKLKKKKDKLKNLISQDEMNNREECSEVFDSLEKSKSVVVPLVDSDFHNSMEMNAEPDNESLSQKKKKKKKDLNLSCADADCSSKKIEESVTTDLSPRKKKRKHRSSFCSQEETDDRQDIKKDELLQSNFLLGTSKKLNLEQKIKKQRKEKEFGGEVSGQEICEVLRNDENSSKYQEDIVDKLWIEIKSKIESKIQPDIKNKIKKTASEQKEEEEQKNESVEGEGDCYSMIFKFDNDPLVRHYIPKKLMTWNGIDLQLRERDHINLKIPKTFFKGSSLDSIAGYGYNT